MGGNRRTNKARNQIRQTADGTAVNAKWLQNQKDRNRQRNKQARKSRRANRGQ